MLITRETDYALRILRALSRGDQMTVAAISQDQQVPKQFAYKIIKKLSKGGLVSIARGAEGGCSLAADLRQVSLYGLLRMMEEAVHLTACMDPDYACPWREANGRCVAHCQLAALQQTLDRELQAHSLHQILFGAENVSA